MAAIKSGDILMRHGKSEEDVRFTVCSSSRVTQQRWSVQFRNIGVPLENNVSPPALYVQASPIGLQKKSRQFLGAISVSRLGGRCASDFTLIGERYLTILPVSVPNWRLQPAALHATVKRCG